jgi:pimeloyl-ACP methyl ester carboxylesterase
MPKVVLNNGLMMHYEQVGQGPDVVLIHGLTGNLAVWHLNVVPLLWDHFRVLTYDLRGHGYSGTPPTGYSLGDMTTDLEELLDALNIRRAALVGHSFGADLSLYFAYRRPERVTQAVAVEAVLPALMHLRSSDAWAGWEYWADVLARSGHVVPAEHRHDVHYLLRLSLDIPKKWGPLKGLPRNPKRFLQLLDHTTVAQDYLEIGELTLDNISRIQTPVVLIYGEGSAFLGSQDYLLAHLPHASALRLPKTEWGHFGPLEQPRELVVCLLPALRTGAALASTAMESR